MSLLDRVLFLFAKLFIFGLTAFFLKKKNTAFLMLIIKSLRVFKVSKKISLLFLETTMSESTENKIIFKYKIRLSYSLYSYK